jgi:hypothetical protein
LLRLAKNADAAGGKEKVNAKKRFQVQWANRGKASNPHRIHHFSTVQP